MAMKRKSNEILDLKLALTKYEDELKQLQSSQELSRPSNQVKRIELESKISILQAEISLREEK